MGKFRVRQCIRKFEISQNVDATLKKAEGIHRGGGCISKQMSLHSEIGFYTNRTRQQSQESHPALPLRDILSLVEKIVCEMEVWDILE